MVPSQMRSLFAGIAFVLALAGTATACAPAPAPAPPAAPTWTFTVQASFPRALVASYGSEAAVRTKITDQFASVNQRFAALGPKFKLTTVSFYTGPSTLQVEAPHPGALYQVVYSESDPIWYEWRDDVKTILAFAASPMVGGVFGTHGTEALTHEFGHSRGAFDLRQQDVAPTSNPITGTGYSSEESIMNFPYGTIVWDRFSQHVIKSSADSFYDNAPIIRGSIPATISYRVVDAAGAPIQGAQVDVYPVNWNSNAVQAAHYQWTGPEGTTADGIFQPSWNPFVGSIGVNYDTQFPNLLVTASSGGQSGSAWIPLTSVGSWGFEHPGEPYVLTIQLGA